MLKDDILYEVRLQLSLVFVLWFTITKQNFVMDKLDIFSSYNYIDWSGE